MAPKKGARQRRKKTGKGSPKKPARASTHKLSTNSSKRKVKKKVLSQKELARLARERFLRSKRAKEAAQRKKKLRQEQERLAQERKAILEKRKRGRLATAAVVEESIKVQEEIVEILDKESLPEDFRREERVLYDLKQRRKFYLEPTSVERTKDQIAVKQAIRPSREFLQDRIKTFYEGNKSKLQGISSRHRPGRRWKVDNKIRQGYVLDRVVGVLVDESTLEDLIYMMLQDTLFVVNKFPKGKLYASFSFLEYGKNLPRSSHKVGDDDLGTFYQSFEGTGHLYGGADEVRVLEESLRRVFHETLTEASGKNAVLLVGYEIKSFHELTDEERKARRRARRKKK